MDTRNQRRTYLISAATVWAAILIASAVILRGTPYFSQMLPVLGGGAVWFVVLAPIAVFRDLGGSSSER